MNAEYKRDLKNNYLILKALPGSDAEDYRLKMAEQNRIPGLLPFHSARRDGVLYLHYEITSMQPLENIFEKRTMGYDDILLLLTGIRDVLEAMQKFLLDPAQLVFDPEYLYVDPDCCRVQFCYLPGSGGEFPITMLAEFILKRLDHREQQAIALGYMFYQKATEENFSLAGTLREILSLEQTREGKAEEAAARAGKAPGYRQREPAGGNPDTYGSGESGGGRDTGGSGEPGRGRSAGGSREPGGSRDAYGSREPGRGRSAGGGRESGGGRDAYDSRESGRRMDAEEDWGGVSPEIRESYGVTHRERKRRSEKRLGKLFDYIHPAVLLSTLALFAVLEIAFYLNVLSVTEAGGIFFLLISVEVMVNRFWRSSKEKKNRNRWVVEEDEEMYRMLQEEMYEMPEPETRIGETRCLVPGPETGMEETKCLVPGSEVGMCLVCMYSGSDGIAGPDIYVGTAPVYVGKIKGESDVILDSPTVSRRHARLECRDGVCYVKDLNSRNGTFCNGRRLKPQEQCQFTQGDEISFAEIGYRAVLRR